MSKVFRFVQASTKLERLSLSEGDWIDIKPVLTVAEQKRVDSAGMVTGSPTGKVDLSIPEFSFARTMAYVQGWSFTDAEGKPVKFSRAAVDALTVQAYEEIEDAISAYIEVRDEGKQKPGETQ